MAVYPFWKMEDIRNVVEWISKEEYDYLKKQGY